MMEIRHGREAEIPRMMEIYAHARAFMAQTGNPNQWGPNQWPPQALIEEDVRREKNYVCCEDGRIVGVFFFDDGPDVEPTYACIVDGAWQDTSPYGVVHRIASDGTVKGTGAFCIDWAFQQCGHLRIDTHGDNQVMQRLLARLGFGYRGIIYVHEDKDPRLAYEKSKAPEAPEKG